MSWIGAIVGPEDVGNGICKVSNLARIRESHGMITQSFHDHEPNSRRISIHDKPSIYPILARCVVSLPG
jgi:hypothetical protein